MLSRTIALASVIGLLAGACASGNEDRTLDAESADARIVDCMEDAGYEASSHEVAERLRREDPAFEGALSECAAEIGVELPAPGEAARRTDERVLEDVRCMRESGWDVPEPARGEHGALVEDGMDANVPDDQLDQFDADYEACTGTPWLPPAP